jgi:SAM-dependent methyltransferase
LRCPNCLSNNLIIETYEENFIEIRSGDILCSACRAYYPVRNGIPMMIKDEIPDKLRSEIDANKRHWKEKRQVKSDEWLLSLPLATDDFGCSKGNEKAWINFRDIIASLNLSPDEIVLDLGAGTCWSSAWLAERFKRVVAVDIAEEKYIGLKSADTFIEKKGIFFERVLCDMCTLPFSDESFTLAISNASIHHLYNPAKAFAEISRVLKYSGEFVIINEPICSIFRYNTKLSLREIRKTQMSGADVDEGWNENVYSIIRWKRFFREANFSVKVEYTPYFRELLDGGINYHEGGSGVKRFILDLLKKIKFGRYLNNKVLLKIIPMFGKSTVYCIGKKVRTNNA